MNGIPTENDRVVYANCMEEIKRRTDVVYAILHGQLSTIYPITNIEFVCLQIRKILELIALASLASHKEEFAKQYQKFAQMWQAKRILEDLAKLNPKFYPVPTEQVLNQKTGEVLEVRAITKPYLTKADFADVYQQCSSILHAANPYGPPKQLPAVAAAIPLWIEKIINLLNHHHVQLYSSKHQLWVLMRSKTDGRVYVTLFERIDDPAKIAVMHEKRMAAAAELSQNKSTVP
jgi:hypothetical protein